MTFAYVLVFISTLSCLGVTFAYGLVFISKLSCLGVTFSYGLVYISTLKPFVVVVEEQALAAVV